MTAGLNDPAAPIAELDAIPLLESAALLLAETA